MRTKAAEKGRPFWMHNWITSQKSLAFNAVFLLFIWNILWYSLIWFSLLIKCGKYSFIYKKKGYTDTKLKRSTRLKLKLKKKKKQLACKAFVTFKHTHSLLSVKTVQWQPFQAKQMNTSHSHWATQHQISTLNQHLWSQTSKDDRKQELQKDRHEHHCCNMWLHLLTDPCFF